MYFGSSIYVGAVPEVVEKFGISVEVSSLALALYVFGCECFSSHNLDYSLLNAASRWNWTHDIFSSKRVSWHHRFALFFSSLPSPLGGVLAFPRKAFSLWG